MNASLPSSWKYRRRGVTFFTGGQASCSRPLVGAGPERQRFARRRRALILQVVREERRHHVAAVMRGGVAAEVDAAQRAAGAARPAAVIPRSDDEKVLVLRVVLLEQLVDLDRPVEIFLIPPAGDVERRHRDAVQPRRERLPLPERVVVGMTDEVVPGRQRLAEIAAIGVRQRAELEIPVVGVVAIDQRRGAESSPSTTPSCRRTRGRSSDGTRRCDGSRRRSTCRRATPSARSP